MSEKPLISPSPFPLSIGPFAHFFLNDDSPKCPMTIEQQLFFSGKIDQAAFENSVKEVIQRHPLLNALIDNPSRRYPHWISAQGVLPWIDWGREGEPLEFIHQEYLDLTKELGLRIWVRQGAEKAVVTLQIHHCCSDGIGAMLIVGDLLKTYADHFNSDRSLPMSPPEKDSLETRASSKIHPKGSEEKTAGLWVTLKEILKVFLQQPNELLFYPSRKSGEAPLTDYPRLVSHTFSPDEFQKMSQTVKRMGIALNDLLLSDLLLAIREWNVRLAPQDTKRHIKILMPISLRDGKKDPTFGTNMISYVFILRKEKECIRGKQLIEGIRRETQKYKQTTLKRECKKLLRLTEKVPGAWWLLRKLKGIRITAILTNFGDITPLIKNGLSCNNGNIVVGNLEFKGLQGCPPLRSKTHAAFQITTIGGKMTISTTCTPGLFTMEDTASLLSLFVLEIKKSIGC
jgi:NRPS condensation-like uncharacterized protein